MHNTTYTHTHTHTHTHIHTHTHQYTNTCTPTHTCRLHSAYTPSHIHKHIHTNIRASTVYRLYYAYSPCIYKHVMCLIWVSCMYTHVHGDFISALFITHNAYNRQIRLQTMASNNVSFSIRSCISMVYTNVTSCSRNKQVLEWKREEMRISACSCACAMGAGKGASHRTQRFVVFYSSSFPSEELSHYSLCVLW